MRRFRVWLAAAFLGSMVAGCGGGGIQEGMATGEPSQEFKDDLERMGKLMQTTGGGEKKAAAKLKEQLEKPKTGP
jgi:hypothetical protein